MLTLALGARVLSEVPLIIPQPTMELIASLAQLDTCALSENFVREAVSRLLFGFVYWIAR